MTITVRDTAIHKNTVINGITVSVAIRVLSIKSGINVTIIELKITIGMYITKSIDMDTDTIDMLSGIEQSIAKDIVTDTKQTVAKTMMSLSAV